MQHEMTRKQLERKLAAGGIVALTREEWEKLADGFEVVEEHDTCIAGKLRLVRGKAGLAAMESRTRINADGFGIGWYQPEITNEPAVFKDLTAAWNNANLRSLSGKVASPCILAHVRAARRNDTVCRVNCHPFQRGALLWMHNGDIPRRGRLHRFPVPPSCAIFGGAAK